MAAGVSEIALLILLMIAGSGRDALSLVDSQWYFEHAKVNYEETDLLALLEEKGIDLAGPVRDLGSLDYRTRVAARKALEAAGGAAEPWLKEALKSDDVEVRETAREILGSMQSGGNADAIRRLMVIRALGDLKSTAAVGALEKLRKSDKPFVAEYAAAALAKIQGGEIPARKHADSRAPLKWFPGAAGLVVGVRASAGGSSQSVLDAIGLFQQQMSGLRRGDGAEKVSDAERKKQINQLILDALINTGNFRVDAGTLALSSEFGRRSGHVTMLFQGRYDLKSTKAFFEKLERRQETKKINGTTFLIARETMVGFLNDRELLLVVGPRKIAERYKMEELLNRRDAVAAGKPATGAITGNEDLKPLLERIDAQKSAALWAVCKFSEDYKSEKEFTPFDTAVLRCEPADGGLRIQVSAIGTDAKEIKDRIDRLNAGVAEFKGMLEKAAEQVPMAKALVDKLASFELMAGDGRVTGSLTLPHRNPGMLLTDVMMMAFSGRSASRAVRRKAVIKAGAAINGGVVIEQEVIVE